MYLSPWTQAMLLPRKWDVCGIIVPPLGLWHVHMLETARNKYLCGGDVDENAAAEVLMYATLTLAEGRKLFLDAAFRGRVRNRIVKQLEKFTWDEIHAAIGEYTTSCCRQPGHKRIVPKPGETKPKAVAAPTAWVYAEYLSGGDPGKLEEVFETPFSIAACMFDASRSANGEDDTLITEADEERIDRKLELRARLAKNEDVA